MRPGRFSATERGAQRDNSLSRSLMPMQHFATNPATFCFATRHPALPMSQLTFSPAGHVPSPEKCPKLPRTNN
jgi:hypothetical protein